MTAIDLSILDFIQAHFRCGFLDAFMPFVTKFGEKGLFWIALTVLFLCIPKTRKLGVAMGLALALDFVFTNLLIKPLVARVRPYDINTAVTLLVAKPTSYSFPSGHAAASFAAATALCRGRKDYGIPALILAALVSLSRLYLYVHYPSDVLAGTVIGILCGFAGFWLAGRLLARLHGRKDKE